MACIGITRLYRIWRGGGNSSVKYHYVVTKDLATFGLSLSAGFGLILIIVALAVSVVAGESAAYLVSMALVVGLVLMFIGIAGWLVVVQPWQKFDDINQPLDDGHGHAPAEPHADEHAIVPHDDAHAVEPAQH
jgi:ABC-type nickel/cobalt efflux system permease component RcnA